MRKAKLVTPPTEPGESLLTLLGLPKEMRGTVEVLLQCPAANSANISIGTKDARPGFIIPGGAASLETISLSTTYVSGDGSNTLAVMVLK